MTLIVALACKDGVILASDSQATTFSTGGPVRRTISKIKYLGDHKLWAASGIEDIRTPVENLVVLRRN